MILLETFVFAFCVILFQSDQAKLISATAVTACFTLIACYTRPYIEDVEDWTDIAGRVFLLATLGVGIALNEGVGRGGQAVCDVVLAVTVIASNGLFLVVPNPLKLLRGVAKAVREARHAAKIAGWDDAAIKKLGPHDITAITADDVALCSPLQIWELLKHHGGSDSLLPTGIFDGVTALNFGKVNDRVTSALLKTEEWTSAVKMGHALDLTTVDLSGKIPCRRCRFGRHR